MIEAFDIMESRFAEVETLLQDPVVSADRSRLSTLSREHGQLTKKLEPYRRYRQLSKSLAEARLMAAGDDPDMADLAREEGAALEVEGGALKRALEDRSEEHTSELQSH